MIVRCEFEKHEPVRNVTALAVMWYCCNFLSSCRTDGVIGMGECHAAPRPGVDGILWSLEPLPYPEWRAWCADPTKPDAGYESMKARGLL